MGLFDAPMPKERRFQGVKKVVVAILLVVLAMLGIAGLVVVVAIFQ